MEVMCARGHISKKKRWSTFGLQHHWVKTGVSTYATGFMLPLNVLCIQELTDSPRLDGVPGYGN